MKNQAKLTKAGIFSALVSFRRLILSSIAFILAAGTFYVPRLWIYAGILFLEGIIIAYLMIKVYPELANSRGKKQKGTKKWDLLLVSPYILILIIIAPVIAGLDTTRFKWSYLELPYLVLGFILYLMSIIIIEWAMITNKHFEGTVRIQEDRDHKVITNGPYTYIRHPGYLGMIINSLAIPLILGSLFTFIPIGMSIILILIRTYLEDKTLQNELPGYKEYTLKTKYRLLPFIW